MLPTRYSVFGSAPLPPCDGPRLAPFRHRKEGIKFFGRLSSSEDDNSANGGHAHVFEVCIKGTRYALKVFKFYDVKEDRESNFPGLNRRISDTIMTYQSDPFFAECRAYGRISELQDRRRKKLARSKISDIAVPCYGFLGLPATFEDLFREKYGIFDWHRDEVDAKKLRDEQAPFRALVKRLVIGQKAILRPAKMISDLKKLREGGIYQKDIAPRNYLGGLLVDFSVAWTIPHWSQNALGELNRTTQQNQELYDFDRMMREGRIKTRVRAAPDEDALGKLRPRAEDREDLKSLSPDVPILLPDVTNIPLL